MRNIRKLLGGGAVAVVAGALAIIIAAGPAAAGGWAVPAFDPIPPLVAGQSTTIGLTILQHGVHPVDVDDVGLVYTGTDGRSHRFVAEPDGTPGHYVAEVTLPAGTYTWVVQPGWFPPHELGEVTVAASGATTAALPRVPPGDDGSGVSTGRTAARVLLPLGAFAAAGAALMRPRRRASGVPARAATP